MTVLQSGHISNESVSLGALALLSRSYALAVANAAPLAHVRGLDLVEAVFDLVDAMDAPVDAESGRC
jgi:hypothetical protein